MSERANGIPALFGSMVFTEDKMRQRLSAAAFAAWQECLRQGRSLDKQLAVEIAGAMKDWAIEMGATHYTHWFQPMTGFTAEKHDSFIVPDGHGGILMELSAKELTRGEADASSFPSGGLRATFEARGYTAWDPSSYAFIKDNTLYIPTIFCSYSGETLDKKTPLLRSMAVLDHQCVRILRLFGNKTVQHVTAQVGAEQEYFLIDKKHYRQRQDLMLCGRTLFGAMPPKGQELDDHYYGAIKPRVASFMHELDRELWQVGVLAKTEHNEAAPSQHELAPVYSDANSACDHNQLTMELLKKVADRHDLVCLLHEKPFAGVNGSGKHNNWSLSTDQGENLLKPGKTPSQNAQFLLFLAAFLQGADEYQELLRCCVAYPGNDFRLGGNEAPPAVVSVFLGDELTAILHAIITGEEYVDVTKRKLEIGVDLLPEIPQDTTDRNRTSPLAFTGNKFEFRAPGSSQNCAASQTVLNTIVAESLDAICDKLDARGGDFNEELQLLLQRLIRKHKRILFSGDGYGPEWPKEAEARGLPNLRNTPEAIAPLTDEANRALFAKYGVLDDGEISSRHEIAAEDYASRVLIEGKVALELARSMIRPVVADEFSRLATAIGRAKRDGLKVGLRGLGALSQKLGAGLDDLHVKCERLEKAIAKGDTAKILAAAADLRSTVDRLELLVDDGKWPLPKYRQMLFVY